MNPLPQVFESAFARLATQTKKSHDGFVCKYRDPQGNACLFGAMIDDENYNPLFDEDNVSADDPGLIAAIRRSTGVYLPNYLSTEDLYQLQRTHDDDWEPGQDFMQVLDEDLAEKIWGPLP